MPDKIDKRAIETYATNGTLLVDIRLKLLEVIGVVNELVDVVADLRTRQQAAAQTRKGLLL